LRQVGQSSRLLGLGSLAARQSAKPVEIHRFRSDADQISVQELGVARFIQSIASDILRGIAVKILKRRLVGIRRRRYARQFRVLLPEIGLNQLRCGYKSENRDITARKLAVAPIVVRKIVSAKDACACYGRSHCETTSQERRFLTFCPVLRFINSLEHRIVLVQSSGITPNELSPLSEKFVNEYIDRLSKDS
jgi:hypothetical protein